MNAFEIVRNLAEVRLPNVFNPYADICDVHDLENAAEIRKNNLFKILNSSVDERVDTMWVARDLGYLGGRRTGVALTDELHLARYASHFRSLSLEKATRGSAQGERTASVTWDMLDRIGHPVFLWNAFPLHPHEPGRPFTNRCHTRSERLSCKPIIVALIKLIRPRLIVTIGNDAEVALADMGVNASRVRHPSYGGKADFISGLCQIYGISPQDRMQHELAL